MSGKRTHRPDTCVHCLEQQVACEVFTGGATSGTFMRLALAHEASPSDDDLIAPLAVNGSTRSKGMCLIKAREKYNLILSKAESGTLLRANSAPAKERLSLLETYRIDEPLACPVFASFPSSYWDIYFKSRAPQRDGTTPDRFETHDPSVSEAICHALHEDALQTQDEPTPSKTGTTKDNSELSGKDKVRKRKRRIGVARRPIEDELAKLLHHLGADSGPTVSPESVKRRLLEHFQRIINENGTAQHELAKVLRFWGQREDMDDSFITRKRKPSLVQAQGKVGKKGPNELPWRFLPPEFLGH
ncbi:hypothetical protein CALVIDRAFT_552256 [Calocera viscosa TUFC12733]|uniref:Uncharacterized protein n=1 Tax=Calocera viscosa (strain TUFC12733) TaxID=1330018 RepID=A0A167RPY5_CALVF|nr:hypothetical protein CALVIDRAFT_552256 [Calocera viscosa TUFC12733]